MTGNRLECFLLSLLRLTTEGSNPPTTFPSLRSMDPTTMTGTHL